MHRRLLGRALPVVHPPGAAGGAPAGRLCADRALARPTLRHRPRTAHGNEQHRGAGRRRRCHRACASGRRAGPGLRGRTGRHRDRHRLRRRPGRRHAGGPEPDGVGAAARRCPRRHGARALPAFRLPDQGGEAHEALQGPYGGDHRRRLRLRTGERAHRCARGHERGHGRRAARRAGPGRSRDRRQRRAGAGVPAGRVEGSRGRGLGRGHAGALRRAALRLQQRRCRLRRADLGEHAAGLGMGARRQPDGRGARRARVHADDAGGGAQGSRTSKATSSTPRRWPAC